MPAFNSDFNADFDIGFPPSAAIQRLLDLFGEALARTPEGQPPRFLYPASDLDQPERLLGLLGSFWHTTYEGLDLVRGIVDALGRLAKQTENDYQELVDLTGLATTPVYHTACWLPLELRESQRNSTLTSLWRYDEGGLYNDGIRYDVPKQTERHTFPIPDDLVEAPLITNAVAGSRRAWIAGFDYQIDRERGTITFRENPFEDDAVEVLEEWSQQRLADRVARLWIFRAKTDKKYLAKHHGYLWGLDLKSSESFKQLLLALLSATMRGTSEQALLQLVTAVTGIPLAKHTLEHVEDVVDDGRRLLVITNLEVYRFSREEEARVVPGDYVKFGDPLIEALEIIHDTDGNPPEQLRALALGRQHLLVDLSGEITFENATVPLEIDKDDDGATVVRFALGGNPDDVEAFWEAVHARGLARGQTFAQLLAGLEGDTQPESPNLPYQINPLGFLLRHLLRFHTYIIRYRVKSLPEEALGLRHWRQLSRVLPPWMTVILAIELELDEERVTMGTGSGDVRVEETLGGLLTDGFSETVPLTSWITESIQAKHYHSVC